MSEDRIQDRNDNNMRDREDKERKIPNNNLKKGMTERKERQEQRKRKRKRINREKKEKESRQRRN